MINIFYKFLFTVTILCFTYTAFSSPRSNITKQDTIKTDTANKRSSFKLGVDYTSNNVFVGRAPQQTTPIISPEAKYTFKPGLYLSGTVDYLPTNKKNKLDGGDISAGYDIDITDDLAGEVSYTKLFYNPNSTQIGSSISSTFNVNFDYDIGTIITPSISFDYDINKQGINNDEFLTPSLSHDFIFEKLFGSKDLLLIVPTVAANVGTQNFYDAYVTKKVFKSAVRTAKQNALITQFEQTVNQFILLDYELSLPIEYKAGPFILQFTPTYAIAKNEFKSAAIAKALGVVNRPSVFYFTTGVSWKF